ncbi:uncharacterized protein LAESUDRAFT_656143 [Laetiporus sulphureus 93-53]|uniref:dihydroneopterin aldolase n=1 Tax=Laetiporus sulphureus 93-53 TaxID=1314785 RepID=A0A165DN73_9APHY|nr:uncharacterized protein LAESUDRAFT_656143 [Laetiporus sulphureus 93-53]KZT05253.1 hypothetical protein LAESUDRAFT_656143 [Laetiporus sulphureus 93-53]
MSQPVASSPSSSKAKFGGSKRRSKKVVDTSLNVPSTSAANGNANDEQFAAVRRLDVVTQGETSTNAHWWLKLGEQGASSTSSVDQVGGFSPSHSPRTKQTARKSTGTSIPKRPVVVEVPSQKRKTKEEHITVTLDVEDIVFIDSIQLSANMDADWWGRVRPQPVSVSVYLHLKPAHLDRAGTSDQVTDTVHYGDLCKNIIDRVESPGAMFDGTTGLAYAVAQQAFLLSGPIATQVRIVVESSKYIPLAEEFAVEVTIPYRKNIEERDHHDKIQVSIKNLSLSTIIGVNPPEREAKQRVLTDIIIHQRLGWLSPAYGEFIARIAEEMERSEYLTLEKFAYEIVKLVCLESGAVDSVTVRAGKPSALSFARVAGVQITRSRSSFVKGGK